MLKSRPVAGLLAAELVSVSGSAISMLAIPWFVLVTTGSPAKTSLVLAAELLGILVLGFPGGVMAGKLGPRKTMMVSDGARCLLVGAVPALHAAGALSLLLLTVIVFAIGAFFAPHQAARMAVLPEILGEDESTLARANSVLSGTNRLTTLIGPPVAGALIAAIGPENALWVDAATFLCSVLLIFVCIPRLAGGEPAPTPKMFSGVATLMRDRLLRPWTFALSVFELTWQGIFAALPILAFISFDRRPEIAGVLLTAFGAGALAGNIVAVRASGSLAARSQITRAKAVQVVVFWVLVADQRPVTIGVALATAGFCAGVMAGPVAAIQTSRIAAEARGPALTAFGTISLGAGVIGLAGAGPLLQASGPRTLFLIVAALQTAASVPFILSTRRFLPPSGDRSGRAGSRGDFGGAAPVAGK
ncbi:MAG TPA: MFS transporter [Solirubrobacteraceae bacterium]|jgi:MFS family permease